MVPKKGVYFSFNFGSTSLLMILKHTMAFLGYLPKLKRGMGIASGQHFLHDFPTKMFLNSLSMDKVSKSYLFSFLRYQTKCVIRRGYSILERLVKLTRFQDFPSQLPGYQDLPPLSFVFSYQL